MSDKPEISIAGRRFIRALLVICAGLLVAEFIIHRHAYFALEATPLYSLPCSALPLFALL